MYNPSKQDNMQNISDFPSINEDEFTLCEVNGHVYTSPELSNLKIFTRAVENHPYIHITRDLLRFPNTAKEHTDLFLSSQESLLSEILHAYWEKGIVEALQIISEHRNLWLSKPVGLLLNLLSKLKKTRETLFGPPLTGIDMICSLSETRNWSSSVVRALAWHPYATTIAVAALDDSVKIYSVDTTVVQLLRGKEQKNITCLAWRPNTMSEIAVGCENCVIIWDLDSNPLFAKPSIKHASIICKVNHSPIVSISWNSNGGLLATCAAYDSQIVVWNVELHRGDPLKRPLCKGNSLVKWAGNGRKVFNATIGTTLRVWDCQHWKSNDWCLISGRVQTCCWSPCSNILFLATNDLPIIYAVLFEQRQHIFLSDSRAPNEILELYDTTKMEANDNLIGGCIQTMNLDPKGQHLAVVFQDTSFVALFNVSTFPILQLKAKCLIAGTVNEVAVCVDFQKNCDFGSCLSIAWSTGRIQHFPIVCSDYQTSPRVNRSKTDGI